MDKLFQNGTEIKAADLQTVPGIYVGRCFVENSEAIYGGYAILKMVSPDSGPIQVDADMYAGFGTSPQSNFYDTVSVRAVLQQAPLFEAEHTSDGIYQVDYQGQGLAQFRKSGAYIVQRNIEYNTLRTNCYYYQFRGL